MTASVMGNISFICGTVAIFVLCSLIFGVNFIFSLDQLTINLLFFILVILFSSKSVATIARKSIRCYTKQQWTQYSEGSTFIRSVSNLIHIRWITFIWIYHHHTMRLSLTLVGQFKPFNKTEVVQKTKNANKFTHFDSKIKQKAQFII